MGLFSAFQDVARRRPLARACALIVTAGLGVAAPARATYAPKIAVVLCPETNASNPNESQASSQGLVGLAGLVGAPYETLTLPELLAQPPGTHSSLWFSVCRVLSDASLKAVVSYVGAHLSEGGSVLLDGPLGAYAPVASGDPAFRGSADTEPLFNLEALGAQDTKNWTVRTVGTATPLSSLPGWSAGTVLTQGLGGEIEVLRLKSAGQTGSSVLLELAGAGKTQPYLLTSKPGKGRVLAISAYGDDAGPATPFRNSEPRGFFDNLLLPRLMDAAEWLLAQGGPAVGLQLSHAPMTAVIRLDGDQSDIQAATEAALDYLVKLGRDTGVTTVYGVVSSLAQRGEWAGFSPLMPEIEKLGGVIASHSHTHNYMMSSQTGAGFWDTEIRQSLAIIRDHFASGAFAPEVKTFINPGDEILWHDYNRFFADIKTYMTHGFEDVVPYATGMSGFGLPAGVAPVALLSDSIAPDFQWLYDPEWDYPVAQVTAYQKQILGYYQNRVGRGALYNQMWHDYAINNDPPLLHPGDLPAPLFDANRAHFARERIFAPGVAELSSKLHIAQAAALSATASGNLVSTTLDLSGLSPGERGQMGGMGLRLAGSLAGQVITGVTVDGAEYGGFNNDTVILPGTSQRTLLVAARLGDVAAATVPRLTYISKAATPVLDPGKALKVNLASPGLATRFCFVVPAGWVILGADRYAPAGGETCGSVKYGSTFTAVELRVLRGPWALAITSADRGITSVQTTASTATLEVAAGGSGDKITFRASAAPLAAKVGGSNVAVVATGGGGYALSLGSDATSTVSIEFTPDPAVPPPPPVMTMDAGPSAMDTAPTAEAGSGLPRPETGTGLADGGTNGNDARAAVADAAAGSTDAIMDDDAAWGGSGGHDSTPGAAADGGTPTPPSRSSAGCSCAVGQSHARERSGGALALALGACWGLRRRRRAARGA